MGPIGLLLNAIHRVGAAMDINTYYIHVQNELPIPILQIAHQMLNPLVQQLAIRSRTQHASLTRSAIPDVKELDHDIIAKVFRKKIGDAAKVAAYYATLG